MKFSRLVVPFVIVLVALALVFTSTPKSSAPQSPTEQTADQQTTTAAMTTARDINDNDLAPRFTPGQSRRYLVFSKTIGENQLSDQPDPIRNTSEIFLIFNIECVAHDETGSELVLTYERIRSTTLSPNLSLRSDTKTDTDTGQENSSVAYLRAIDVPVTISLDANDHILDVAYNHEDFDDTVSAFRLSLFLLNINGFRHHFDLLFAHTAEQSDLRPNTPWTRYIQYEGPTANRWIETEHTLLDSTNGTAQVAFTGYVQEAAFTENVPDPAAAPEFPNIEGTYEWSTALGTFLSAEFTEVFSRELAIGGSLQGTSSGQTNTVIRLVDDSFELDPIIEQLSRVDAALGPRPAGAANIDRDVLRARNQTKLPAIGAAIFSCNQMLAFGIVGERNADTEIPVRTDDRFNLGFVTSSLVTSAIGTLVTEGVLAWDTPITRELVPTINEAYEGITLTQLLGSRAGLPGFISTTSPEYELLQGLRGNATSFRLDALNAILSAEPAYTPGSNVASSAASTTAAIVLAEQATGKGWADVFHEAIIAPLNIRSAQFDWPANAANPDQPQGHLRAGDAFAPIPMGGAPAFDALRRPATGLSLSLEDFARFASHELAALNGTSQLLNKADAERIHTPQDSHVAMNWLRFTGPRKAKMHWNGSMSGGFTSIVILVPELDLGIVAVANGAGDLPMLRDFALEMLQKDPRLTVTKSRITPTIE